MFYTYNCVYGTFWGNFSFTTRWTIGFGLILISISLKGNIRFENVTFYSNPGKPVLKDVNVEIPCGKTVALVGKTGIGKTTFASLIPRFYEPIKGKILIDGYNIRELTLESLRKQIGFISQEPFLFHGTIRENIAFGVQRTPRLEETRLRTFLTHHSPNFLVLQQSIQFTHLNVAEEEKEKCLFHLIIRNKNN